MPGRQGRAQTGTGGLVGERGGAGLCPCAPVPMCQPVPSVAASLRGPAARLRVCEGRRGSGWGRGQRSAGARVLHCWAFTASLAAGGQRTQQASRRGGQARRSRDAGWTQVQADARRGWAGAGKVCQSLDRAPAPRPGPQGPDREGAASHAEPCPAASAGAGPGSSSVRSRQARSHPQPCSPTSTPAREPGL